MPPAFPIDSLLCREAFYFRCHRKFLADELCRTGWTVTHTGGSLTQDGGGAGLLVGHNAVGTYNISGGNLLVTGSAPNLKI